MSKTAIGATIWLAATGLAAVDVAGVDWSRDGVLPGLEVEASGWAEVTHRGATFRCTQLLAPGAPAGARYRLWQRWLDGGERPLEPTIRTADGGLLVDALDGSPVHTCLGDFYPGEPLEVALISEDQRTRILGVLIPFPLEASSDSGACRLALRMVNVEGTVFFARAGGFASGESLKTDSLSGKDHRRLSTFATDTGTLSAYVQPQVAGKKGGTASFSVTGTNCSVSIEYDWGRSMRRR